MSSTRSAPCRSSASSIGSMFLMQTKLLIILLDFKMRMGHFLVIFGVKLILGFSYISICTLSLLHRLHKINVDKAVEYIVSCKNLDGGFGAMPGGESHAGQIFCCVGALAITGSLHHIDRDLLGWWLCERQCRDGGLNGRPEKLADVCYSWWVLSSLIIIDRVHWIDKEKLAKFILNCQDKENGGISDRPDNAVDIYHTYFGVAGLSLTEYPGVKPIDPAYALPLDVVNRIFLTKQQ
ncbi:unnamed protein product [Triticum turgidum subsp. durum]|uniref:Geranylgeranyl transferase type-2 subunit beta n=1 Tax=Triticum turgidum subsp. durum TaxID=4567 RepID=A0A9R0ZXU7_TRITD|nr:unnamed protein product [Triticum turgidum subsp. durum]